MEDDNSTDNLSCLPTEYLTDQELKTIGVSGIVASSISITLCIIVILLMIVFKKYVFAIQRMIMYLNISILFNTLNQLLQRVAYNTIHEFEAYCIGLAAFSQYSAYCILLSMICALFELILRIVFKKEGRYIEIIYLLIIFVLPIGVSYIPYAFNAYGVVNTFCTVTISRNCQSFTNGLILEAVLWWVPLYGTIVFALVSYPFFYYVIKRDRKRYSAIVETNRNQVAERALEEVGYFKYLPIMFIVLDLIPIATMIHGFVQPYKPIVVLWAMTAVVKGIQGGIVATVISLDPKTFKRLTVTQLRSAIKNNILMNSDIKDYPIQRSSSYTDSFEGSRNKYDDKKDPKTEYIKTE